MTAPSDTLDPKSKPAETPPTSPVPTSPSLDPDGSVPVDDSDIPPGGADEAERQQDA